MYPREMILDGPILTFRGRYGGCIDDGKGHTDDEYAEQEARDIRQLLLPREPSPPAMREPAPAPKWRVPILLGQLQLQCDISAYCR